MKKFTTILIITFFVIACMLSSCRKSWECYNNGLGLLFVKGTDSIYGNSAISPTGGAPSYNFSQSYQDSLISYYKQRGYKIDTIDGGSINEQIGPNPETVKALEEDGWNCFVGGRD